MCGLKSSFRCRSMATIAVPGVKCEHSIFATARAFGPGSLSLTSAQSLPSLRDTQSFPSSVPTHSTPAFTGDSASARMLWPLGIAISFGGAVRSALILSHASPRVVDL